MNEGQPNLSINVHLRDDTTIKVDGRHLDSPLGPWVDIKIGDTVSIFVSSVEQAEMLLEAAFDARDAFVLAGEPVSA